MFACYICIAAAHQTPCECCWCLIRYRMLHMHTATCLCHGHCRMLCTTVCLLILKVSSLCCSFIMAWTRYPMSIWRLLVIYIVHSLWHQRICNLHHRSYTICHELSYKDVWKFCNLRRTHILCLWTYKEVLGYYQAISCPAWTCKVCHSCSVIYAIDLTVSWTMLRTL